MFFFFFAKNAYTRLHDEGVRFFVGSVLLFMREYADVLVSHLIFHPLDYSSHKQKAHHFLSLQISLLDSSVFAQKGEFLPFVSLFMHLENWVTAISYEINMRT